MNHALKKNIDNAIRYGAAFMLAILFCSCQNGRTDTQNIKSENYIPDIAETEEKERNTSGTAKTIIIEEEEEDQEKEPQNTNTTNIYAANTIVNNSTSAIVMTFPAFNQTTDAFRKKETEHVTLYEENEVSEDFINNAEDIYKKLNAKMPKFMLQPRAGKVSIYLARTSQTLPQFNKAHSLDTIYDILENKKIYIYKNSSYYGLLAHEITHYYFGSFFTVQNPAPYWLMEGLSIYMQIELAGKKSMPDWFDEYQGKISRGAGFSYKVLSVIDDIEGAEEDSIRIWHAQAYSLVKYLIELKGMDTFYSFCDHLKKGYTDNNAFYYVYGKTSRQIEQSWLRSITDPDYLKGIIKSRQNNKIGYWKK